MCYSIGTNYIKYQILHVFDDILLNPSNILQTCYIGCETGTYDINCSKTCRHCKNSETCDIDTGECDDIGCALPGFKPPMCSGK